MNKNIPALGLMALLSPTAFAGTMGPAVEPAKVFSFVQIEGNYTWNQINGYDIAIVGAGGSNVVIQSENSNNGWGGRLAAGTMRQITNTPFFMSGEIGYGYYGNTNLSPIITATGSSAGGLGTSGIGDISIKVSQDGFDALAGVIYNQPVYDLFFKAGALVQNSRLNASAAVNLGSPLGINFKSNRTEVLPEIKLGGAYHINENFAIFAAWTHAFGSNTQLNVGSNNTTTIININLENPTLDVASLGLDYRFA